MIKLLIISDNFDLIIDEVINTMFVLSQLVIVWCFIVNIECSSFAIPNNDNLADVEDRCTTVIVGKDAGIDGPMTSHTV